MSRSQRDIDEAAKQEAKRKLILQGHLHIDYDQGTATFVSGGITVLRVTHLPTPVPPNVSIDLVAIRNVTSYTPVAPREDAPPIDERPVWADREP
jgi:hypothetical protein